MSFELHPNFHTKMIVGELELSTILLNETKECPWIFLIPRKPNIIHMSDLSRAEQHLLMDEIDFCSKAMEVVFNPDRLNVAAIGNMTPQLHVHIICRYTKDPHWPDVCWNKPLTEMTPDECEARAAQLCQALS